MGLFSFLAKAGKNIFGGKDDKPVGDQHASSSTNAATAMAQEAQAAVIRQHVQQSGVNIQGLDVRFDGNGRLVMNGQAASKADYEKAALIAGNVMGVSQVDSQVSFPDNGEADAQTYEVQSGDTLSKISKQFYGDPNQYMKIVEANQPMIKDPDEIYPGQTLRIPAQVA
jgi:nucleoid-associated protein YgaU